MEHPIHQQITDLLRQHNCWFNEKIIFNAGRTTSIGMKSADYKELVQPKIAAIV
ncbi:MAG: hypothetical protein AAB834_04085 [Patescibacteria group bacterium]